LEEKSNNKYTLSRNGYECNKMFSTNNERFHNQLAILLGYKRILANKRISISVEESDIPFVTLKVMGNKIIRINAFEILESKELQIPSDLVDEIRIICETVHIAYLSANRPF